MHEQAALDFYPENRPQVSVGVGQLVPTDIRVERRIDRILNDTGDVSFHLLLSIRRDPDDLPGLAASAEHQHPAPRVRERGQLIGQLVPAPAP